MIKALSRNHRSQDYDARETARAAARRSGKSLGDWLDDVIRDEVDDDVDDRSDDGVRDNDSLDAAARRLARPRFESRPLRRWRDDAREGFDAPLDDPPRSRHGSRNDAQRRREHRDYEPPEFDPRAIVDDAEAIVERRLAESERHTARALGNLANLIKRGHRDDDGETVKRAMSAFAQRAEKSERKTARALSDIAGLLESERRDRDTAEEGLAFLADRLGRLETKLSEQPALSARPIRSALARLESRLDRLSHDDHTTGFENALSGLDKRLDDIARRLDDDARGREDRDQPARVAPPAANLTSASAAALEQGLRRAPPNARRPLVDAIAEITRRQRVLDDAVTSPAPLTHPPAPAPDLWEGEPPSRRFASLNSTLDTIAQQLDNVRQDAGERADRQMVVMRQVEGLRRDMGDVSQQLDHVRIDAGGRAEEQKAVTRHVESLRREVNDMSRAIGDLAPRASIAAIESALRDLAHRVETQRHRGVTDDLLAPAERIAGELRAVIKELDPSPIVRNLHADVETIGRRLDAMQAPDPADFATLRELSQQTREIKEQLSALAARPLPLEKIETRLFDLTQRVDALAYTGGNGAAKAAAAFDMGELVKGIRSIVASETSSGFETFNRRLEQLASKLDEAVARSGGKRFDELGDRIEALGKSLAQRIEKSGGSKTVDTGPLEQLVAKLAKKIDSALDQKPYAPGFEEIGRKIERLETRFTDAAPVESIARIEAMLAKPAADRQFAELAQRIDLVHKTLAHRLEQGAAPREGADLRYIEELVRGLDQKIEAAVRAEAPQPDLQPIERQLSELSYKIDRLEDTAAGPRAVGAFERPEHASQLDAISDRLERMQGALAQRVDEGARVEEVESRQNELTALVRQLAERMNQALDPRGDASALKSLESQIGALSQRLDRSDFNGAALAGIESKISALVAQVEDARGAAAQAAEEAVRRATQDMLRAASSPEPGALRDAIGRELTDIRKTQDESGQRTHETLLAVHETLERVVDRLAMFEDELSEIRSAPEPVRVPDPPAPLSRRRDDAPKPASKARGPDWPAVKSVDTPRGGLAYPAPQLADAPEPMASTGRTRIETSDDEDLSDFLLPPGGAAPRREPSLAQPARDDIDEEFDDEAHARQRSAQTDFIAAARRAAQQAAFDAEAAQAQQARRAAARAGSPAPAGEAGVVARVGSTLQERKRPLLLGLGALVLLVGAYQVARFSIMGGESAAPAALHDQHESEATAPAARPLAAPETPAPAARAPKEAGPPPPRMISPPTAADPASPPAARPDSRGVPLPRMIPPPRAEAPLDQAPTGSIGAAGPLATPDSFNAVKALATQGDAAAGYELGVRYAEGRGVARDAKAAVQWFEKAAGQGLAPAQYRLGSMYEKGVGVDRNYALARRWYQMAADAGNARSMHNLAVLLAEGGDGKPDYATASEWFRKAAEFGVRDSQFNLAILYARGLGVSQNLTQSYLWFSAAAAQGDEDAGKKRDEVAARLDSKELAAAKAAAGAFKAKEPLHEANDVLPPRGGWESVKTPPTAKPAAKTISRPKVSQI